MNRLATLLAGLSLSATMSVAAEKTLMHCFAFTPIETASQAEWDAFSKATDELPKKIKGLKRVWYGKLARPLAQNQLKFADPEVRKKMTRREEGDNRVRDCRAQERGLHGVRQPGCVSGVWHSRRPQDVGSRVREGSRRWYNNVPDPA